MHFEDHPVPCTMCTRALSCMWIYNSIASDLCSASCVWILSQVLQLQRILRRYFQHSCLRCLLSNKVTIKWLELNHKDNYNDNIEQKIKYHRANYTCTAHISRLKYHMTNYLVRKLYLDIYSESFKMLSNTQIWQTKKK